MSTHTQILYQVVFSTKYRKPTLKKEDRPQLFKLIWGLLKNKRCHLYRINGIEDHLHIIFALHPSVSLASLVKDIKLSATAYIKQTGIFPDFGGWQEGYGAFTYSVGAKGNLIRYVKNQEEHHKKKSSKAEYISMLEKHQIEYDVKFLE
ncbi:MAG TPA: IS200/IS605 family transposase [Saprospirales bacterium]|nr:IS200/IS605 family transposase [Saprospirales bacterium]